MVNFFVIKRFDGSWVTRAIVGTTPNVQSNHRTHCWPLDLYPCTMFRTFVWDTDNPPVHMKNVEDVVSVWVREVRNFLTSCYVVYITTASSQQTQKRRPVLYLLAVRSFDPHEILLNWSDDVTCSHLIFVKPKSKSKSKSKVLIQRFGLRLTL